MVGLSRRNLLKFGAAVAISPSALLFSDSWARDKRRRNPFDPYLDAVLVDGEPPKPTAGSFTVAVLPDTQHYSEKYPETFLAQTGWLAANATNRNIACVMHLGDITNCNTPLEWKRAVAAMELLDGRVPYFFVPGNHDYSERGHCCDRTTLLNEFFPVDRFRKLPTFGGVYDQEPDCMENSFHCFSAAGRKFLVLALEFCPRRDVVRWAQDVVARHADHEAILMTHAYLYHDDTRYDWKKFGPRQHWSPRSYSVAQATGDGMDGEELWSELVSQSGNFVLTLNGHVLGDGLGRAAAKTPEGRDVHQLLVNFQMRPNGGDGWLRLLEFQPDGRRVKVCDYSPTRGQRNESPQNTFEIALSNIS
ncbi:MAG: metallophosphoesterase [Planctomycetia bacterium]|nr:metallophosphoesterase [Planctomycetia bacterium]